MAAMSIFYLQLNRGGTSESGFLNGTPVSVTPGFYHQWGGGVTELVHILELR